MRASSVIIDGCFAVQLFAIAYVVYRENFAPPELRPTGARLKRLRLGMAAGCLVAWLVIGFIGWHSA